MIEDRQMIEAPAAIAGSAGRITRSMPFRSISKVSSHFASVISDIGTRCAIPALATITPMPP